MSWMYADAKVSWVPENSPPLKIALLEPYMVLLLLDQVDFFIVDWADFIYVVCFEF